MLIKLIICKTVLTVAFSVGYDSFSVLNNNKVFFETFYYNFNDVYNRETGDFEAPISGFYEFNVIAVTTIFDEPGDFYLTLFHNDKYVNVICFVSFNI